jgi:hypothetical protein
LAWNKYGAKTAKAPDGQVFDSQHECQRYAVLKLLQRGGKISGLKRQVEFELIPSQREKSTEVYKAGPQKGLPKPGAVIEKPCKYVADFVYYDEKGNLVVEDAKGCKTEAYKIKKKLMLWVHGIRVKES